MLRKYGWIIPFLQVVAVFQRFFEFSSRKWGEMIQFDDHIFQGGWFNHQRDLVIKYPIGCSRK